MSVDSIGNNSRDASLATRRRILEEERARNLDKIEKEYQTQINQTKDMKQKSLEEIAENEAQEIKDKLDTSEEKIRNVKAAANQRIQSFQKESEQMSTEAKRQFLEKANQLNQTARDLDTQRSSMLRHHSDSLKQIKEEQETSETELKNKILEQTNKSYTEQKKKFNTAKNKGDIEIEQLQSKIKETKDKLSLEAEEKLQSLLNQKELQAELVEKEIDMSQKRADQRLAQIRHKSELDKVVLATDAEGQMSATNIKNQANIQRTVEQGDREISNLKDYYSHEERDIDKTNKNAILNKKLMAQKRLYAIEAESKSQEELAKLDHQLRMQKLHESQQKIVSNYFDETSDLKEKAINETQKEAKALKEQHIANINKQTQILQDEIHHQYDLGMNQVNKLMEQNAKTVASHGARSSDPFYRVQKLNIQINDKETGYDIKLKVPEHEQESVRITHQQNHLTVSGTRRFDGKTSNAEGHEITTHSYQSFSEMFPVTGKLNMRNMSKSYENGTLIFHIPREA